MLNIPSTLGLTTPFLLLSCYYVYLHFLKQQFNCLFCVIIMDLALFRSESDCFLICILPFLSLSRAFLQPGSFLFCSPGPVF
jgi:hypothetical protein